MPKIKKLSKESYCFLDIPELLCELGIFASCRWPNGVCRICRKRLIWCLEILIDKWNFKKYIDFKDALRLLNKDMSLFNRSLSFGYTYVRKEKILQLLARK